MNRELYGLRMKVSRNNVCFFARIPSPDDCGTREREVGCYVPILTRCLPNPLHRSGEGAEIIAKTSR